MRACVQRVSAAQVVVEEKIVGQIQSGLLVLLGVAAGDEERDAQMLADKIVGLRVFNDSAGKMNLALADVRGSMLVVSQFTLLGDCSHGRRPSFTGAAPPELAERFYEAFCARVRSLGVHVATGQFRQHMEVTLINDGPVTLVVESK
jgi:D-tyrosyl-tRNA(Tyr) deacylase